MHLTTGALQRIHNIGVRRVHECGAHHDAVQITHRERSYWLKIHPYTPEIEPTDGAFDALGPRGVVPCRQEGTLAAPSTFMVHGERKVFRQSGR